MKDNKKIKKFIKAKPKFNGEVDTIESRMFFTLQLIEILEGHRKLGHDISNNQFYKLIRHLRNEVRWAWDLIEEDKK